MKTRWNLNIRKEPYLQILLFLLAIYVIFVYLLTLNPFRFSAIYLHQFLQFRSGLIHTIAGKSSYYDILLNLVMLSPVGFILGVYWRISDLALKTALFAGTAIGFLMSASIELSQILLPRTSSIIDIFTNTLGCSAGILAAFSLEREKLKNLLKNLYIKEKSFYLWIVIIYTTIATIILLIPTYFNHFGNWNSDYQLLVGNEMTLNRPWQGSIYKISIFNKVLSEDKIKIIRATNYNRKTSAECTAGLIAEYIFNTVPVINRGYLREEMDLFPLNQLQKEEEDDGFVIENNNLFRTKNGTARFIRFLQDANRLTIALWMKPLTLRQSGPARIISLSSDCNNRNFTLGQSGSMLNFRVRTPLAGNNGSRVSLQSPSILNTDEPQFIVATYHRGEMKLYHNARLLPQSIYDTSPYLPLLIGLREDRFGKIIFCFMLLYPLGWLARGLSYQRKFKYLLSGTIVLIPFVLSSFIKMLHFKHAMDEHLFLAVAGITFFVIMSDLLFDFLKGYITKKYFLTSGPE